MVEMCKFINHNMYEKITDDIMFLSKNWILKFTVLLNRYGDNGKVNYHKEVMYGKQKSNYAVNINRSFDYFLSFECTQRDESGMKPNVNITLRDMYMFKFKLNQVCEWFTSPEHEGLFMRKDGKIIRARSVDPIKLSNLKFGKYIEWEPSVLELNNGSQLIGVFMYFGNDLDYTFLTVDTLLSLKYFVDTFDMFTSAQIMLNYLGRPENGTNLYNMSTYKPELVNTNKFLK